MAEILRTAGDYLFARDAVGAGLRALFIFAVVWGFFVPIMSWVERRVSAFIQDRLGPNRVGPFGLFQVIADGIKFLMKEDVIPGTAHKVLFVLAPAIGAVVAAAAIAVVPFGFRVDSAGSSQYLIAADLDVGILYLLAISSLSVYTIILAGWASNNKYALMGGVRAAAQMISYELPLALAVLSVLVLAGSPKLQDVVAAQSKMWFIIPCFLGFVIYVAAAFAETNRSPFDLPEGESEIVGYHVEYSSMKFALFFMAEYANMVTQSMVITCLFLGGHEFLPFVSWADLGLDLSVWWPVTILWFFAKVGFLMFFYVWVRWTLPRFRYDQLMHLSWKRLVPIGMLNLTLVSVGVYFFMK